MDANVSFVFLDTNLQHVSTCHHKPQLMIWSCAHYSGCYEMLLSFKFFEHCRKRFWARRSDWFSVIMHFICECNSDSWQNIRIDSYLPLL